jgi:hypothetical protein
VANALKLSDGRMINADYIVLVSALVRNDENSGFTLEFSNSTKIVVTGSESALVRDYNNIRQAIGIADSSAAS